MKKQHWKWQWMGRYVLGYRSENWKRRELSWQNYYESPFGDQMNNTSKYLIYTTDKSILDNISDRFGDITDQYDDSTEITVDMDDEDAFTDWLDEHGIHYELYL